MSYLLLLTVFLLAGAGAPASAAETDLTEKELADARRVYVAKCAKCHKFYEPKNYSDADWHKWISAMSKKSKLKPEQDKFLRTYLEEYRAGKIEKIPGAAK